jgi:N-acetylmuramoyl-L-alanine amidase
MKMLLLGLPLALVLIPIIVFTYSRSQDKISGAPPYELTDDSSSVDIDDYGAFLNWERPEVPAKVALQVGHWKTDEAPEEQKKLRGNTGASGGGKAEWEVNMAIANETAEILKEKRIEVEILPTTIPPDYWADVFVAIHADGNEDPDKSGFKAARPRRDMTGDADKLLEMVERNYEEETKLIKDPNVTRNMRGYYAFGWWRYEHAIHPMTAAIILETGFLSSPSDRDLIVDQPEISAKGLADGIIEYLGSEELI